MLKFLRQNLANIFKPAVDLSGAALQIHERWQQKLALVLNCGSSAMTILIYPIFYFLIAVERENIPAIRILPLVVIVASAICLVLPIVWKRTRVFLRFFPMANFLIFFACIAIDLSFIDHPWHSAALVFVPLFGSALVFIDIRVMTITYAASGIIFVFVNMWRNRGAEIVGIYCAAYIVAWFMAYVRVRSLIRISEDQAKLYEQQVDNHRMQLARDLHDSLGGDLMQLSLQLAGDTPREQILNLTRAVIAKTKNMVYTLEPHSENQSFSEYVTAYVDRLRQVRKFTVTLDIDIAWPLMRLDHTLNLEAIFTEWMTNTLRHAHANAIRIALRLREKRFWLVIEDNGSSFRWNGIKIGSGLKNIAVRSDLLEAKVFARKKNRHGGTTFVLTGKFQHG